MTRPLKPRSFARLANLWAWLHRREKRAWDRYVRAMNSEESVAHLVASARWSRLMHAAQACPRKAEA